MKNKIYYLGILSSIITACGCLFKIMNWPSAGIIIFIGLISLSVIFLPLAIINMVKSGNDKNFRNFYIIAAIVMAFNFIGVLFKIMHWPGARILLMIGIPLPFIVLLPAYLLSNRANKEINYKNMLAVMFFFAYFAAITSIMAIGVSSNVVKGFITSAGNVEEKTKALKENLALVAMSSGSINPIHLEADKLCNKIVNIKNVLKKQQNSSSGNSLSRDVRPLIEENYLIELKKDINNFRILVQNQSASDSRLYNYVDEAFDIYLDISEDTRWENAWMNTNIVASAIESLNLIEFRVRMIGLESYNIK